MLISSVLDELPVDTNPAINRNGVDCLQMVRHIDIELYESAAIVVQEMVS